MMPSLPNRVLCRFHKPNVLSGMLVKSFSAGPEFYQVVPRAIRETPKASNPSYSPGPRRKNPVEGRKIVGSIRGRYTNKPVGVGMLEPRPMHVSGNNVNMAQSNSSPQIKLSEHVSASLPTSSWVELRSVPPLATLEDVCSSICLVLDVEQKIGIRDLDSPLGGIVSPTTPWIKSAKVVLSSHGRPTEWRVRFENRSIVNAFLEHTREAPFVCVWKPVSVAEWLGDERKDTMEVTDSMIRVENFPPSTTVDIVRNLFRRYDFARSGPSVVRWEDPMATRGYNMFVVHFADPSNARAAVREMQGLHVMDRILKMAQYPKQVI